MSADNWTQCPRCARMLADEAVRLRSEADAAYGVAPLEEWVKINSAAIAAQSAALCGPEEPTFREDYEIGVYGVTFLASYSGSCSKCDLSHSFNHEERIAP